MVGTVILPAQYTILFDFLFLGRSGPWPASPTSADWTQVLQICQQNLFATSNLPTVRVNPTTADVSNSAAQLFMVYDGMADNEQITTPQVFSVGSWTSVVIQIDQVAGFASLALSRAGPEGAEWSSLPRKIPPSPTAVVPIGGPIQVWVSVPDAVQPHCDGQLRGLSIVNPPSPAPTASPTPDPTQRPTAQPTLPPSARPTWEPSSQPSPAPTRPSSHPTPRPSPDPTSFPTVRPSSFPSPLPTPLPSASPTLYPTTVGQANVLIQDLTLQQIIGKLTSFAPVYVYYFGGLFLLLLLLDYSSLFERVSVALHSACFDADRFNEDPLVTPRESALPPPSDAEVQVCSQRCVRGCLGRCCGVRNKNPLPQHMQLLEKHAMLLSLPGAPPARLTSAQQQGTATAAMGPEFGADSLSSRPSRAQRPGSVLPSGRTSLGSLSPSESAPRPSLLRKQLLPIADASAAERYYNHLLGPAAVKYCKPIFFPRGVFLPSWLGCGPRPLFPPGLVEDFLIHLFNTHDFIKCFMCERRVDEPRDINKVVFISTYSISFLIAALTNSFLSRNESFRGSVTDELMRTRIQIAANVLIGAFTSVLQRFASRLVLGMLTLKCVEDSKMVVILRVLISCFVLLACGALLAVSAIITVTRPDPQRASDERTQTLEKYAVQVHLASFFILLFGAIARYFPSFHVNLTICGLSVLSTGCWYLERLYLVKEQPGIDFIISRWTFCCCVTVDYVRSTKSRGQGPQGIELHDLPLSSSPPVDHISAPVVMVSTKNPILDQITN